VKISGFTISRNAVKYGYPIVESIRSLLPLVDELVVGVGDSEDETWDVVTGVDDPKIKPFRTVWDMTKREGGIVLSEQTNLALARCSGDWAVYLQGDEALHEDEIDQIRGRLHEHLNQKTEGLSFSYIHFYGSYATVQDNWCRWYRREVRAVKTGMDIVSVGDAAGFFDPFTGEGIYRALRGAQLAAETAEIALSVPDTVDFSMYDRLRTREFRRKSAVTALVQLFVQHPAALDYAISRLRRREAALSTLANVLGDVEDAGQFFHPSMLWSALRP